MNTAISHRGPDDTGVYISPHRKIGLGHQRLSIIDLTSAGHQPMRYMDRYEIVFNGEIYNFQDQRTALERLGYIFTSQTDTEVILALYDRYKENCVQHLRGMFAFAIYDEKENMLFCARDRVGKKPFKYYLDNDVFLFASELKAILTQHEYKKSPDYIAIHHYLTLQYVPAPWTGFAGIAKLMPAHYMTIDCATGKTETIKYWHLPYHENMHFSEQDWERSIMSKLDEATKIRMIADVPLGVFLSGGIDSSAVTCLMAKHSEKPIKTFSIGFHEKKFNELPHARSIANMLKTEHTEFIINPETIEILPDLVRQYEEPYADSSALPTYYLSKLTREHVKVALNGDGGDENFAGYGRYSIQKFSHWYEKFHGINRTFVQPVTHLLAGVIYNTFWDRADRFTSTLQEHYAHRYVNYICYFTNEEKKKLYTASFARMVGNHDSYTTVSSKFKEISIQNPLNQMLYADIATYLPDDLLVKVDIATMAVGLEGRSPFLDHEFMELASTIPFTHKLKDWNNKKYILKQALQGMVPSSILNRPKKGFSIPIEQWFKSSLYDYAENILLSKRAISRQLFQRDAIERLLANHRTKKVNHANQIWALITLELWFREYMD